MTALATWSRRMSYVLRHNPASAGLTLDPNGWVDIDDLVNGIAGLDRTTLLDVVATDTKQRYTIDGNLIRAAQGHTTPVSAVGVPTVPPTTLLHGTVEDAAVRILVEGLRPGSRHDVHLSADHDTATRVATRRGAPVILIVDAAGAHRAGVQFRVADNGVWLTDHVPAEFITRQP